MGKVIVVTSGKGGVGKSTTTANLGTALALMGKSVVVVDADIGLRNLDVIMGLESRVVYTSMDVIRGNCKLSKALVGDRRSENLKLLAASQTNNKMDMTPEQMKKLSQALKNGYDYVLIDSPAGIEQGFRNAAVGADEALVVTTPEIAAVRDADRVIGLLQASGITDFNLLINRLSPEMVKKGDMMSREDIVDLLSIRLIGVIPEDNNIVISTNRGLPIALNHNSKAGKAFKRVAMRLEGQRVEIPEFIEESWFSNVIGKLFRR